MAAVGNEGQFVGGAVRTGQDTGRYQHVHNARMCRRTECCTGMAASSSLHNMPATSVFCSLLLRSVRIAAMMLHTAYQLPL